MPTQDLTVAHLVCPVLVAHSAPGIVEVVHHHAKVAGGVLGPVDEPNLYNRCRESARASARIRYYYIDDVDDVTRVRYIFSVYIDILFYTGI